MLLIILISLNSVNAMEDNQTSTMNMNEISLDDNQILRNSTLNLEKEILNSDNHATIKLNPGTYYINHLELTKNLTIQGNGNPREIIIDGQNKSGIFIIMNDSIHITFKNITFTNANSERFGGAISIETGHVYVDNCIFANNKAGVNAGGISNYGTDENKGYLLVNNSLFINNHAEHDGGAITTCYADSYIYNSVFINNSAHRDGGAIRVSVSGYGNVEDCIFMFNHADEWGGAYYSWSGISHINRCVFLNNSAGTNGGAVMVSGNLDLKNSIIMNNNGKKTGGSFYIQQPMYDAKTIINVHDNLITNNTSPYGREIFIKWDDIGNLYTKFNNNDWGDENPNDSSIIDPNNVTSRSKVTSTIKSDLLKILNLNLLDKYGDLINSYFPNNSLNEFKSLFNNKHINQNTSESKPKLSTINQSIINNEEKTNIAGKNDNIDKDNNFHIVNSSDKIIIENTTSHGNDKEVYELHEPDSSVSKQVNVVLRIFIIGMAAMVILLSVGYRKQKNKSK